MRLFGIQKAKAAPKDAIVKLRESLEMIDKREKYLNTKIEAELKVAKANASKNKKVALMALKKKKIYQDQADKLMGSRLTLETQMSTLEGASVNVELMNAMKTGNEAIKNIHGNLDVDKVEETMDEINEQMGLANEISEAIARPIGGAEFDDEELDRELEELAQEDLDTHLLETGLGAGLPNVPTTIPAIAQPPRPVREQAEEEDPELAELKASMAM
ncbi:UNVERIFIED_CONTAM: ESCRT-III subunit protein snf7 [Siphonaria sp. JEL0065]|nr:ESCRT-III subunit protein snf7 [Siphonaria sp. JEL0065]